MDPDFVVQLAALAHQCWCAAMMAQGWRSGSTWDSKEKTHDALREFTALSDADRRSAMDAVRFANAAATLAGLVDYPRGDDRPFTLMELRAGLPVSLVTRGSTTRVAQELRGEVDGWTINSTGDLDLIRVRWQDGSWSEHHPAERVLRRV